MNGQVLILCAVYKTRSLEETYIFVDHQEGMDRVPEALKARFPEPQLVTRFKLTEDRQLARADASVVMASIKDQGYYLQMPPPKDAHLSAVAERNEKLPR